MRLAMLSGINEYLLSDANLQGCINDVEEMTDILSVVFGFSIQTILKNKEASKVHVIEALKKLGSSLKKGDEFVWYHSGHGTQIADFDGDEVDGVDEALVMADSTWDTSMFNDDELFTILKDFPKKIHGTMIFDTCFSGGMTRRLSHKLKILEHPDWLRQLIIKNRKGIKRIGIEHPDNRFMFLLASKEDQYSEESVNADGKVMGAFTNALLQVSRKKGKTLDNISIIAMVKEKLIQNGFKQNPKMSADILWLHRSFLGAEASLWWKRLMRWFD